MIGFIRYVALLSICLGLNACGGAGDTPAPIPVPPDAPTVLTAIAGNQQVLLSWQASPQASAYHVKRALVSGGPYLEIAAPRTTNFTDSGLSNGSTYYYVVTASHQDGESAPSAEAAATPSTALPPLPDDDPTRNHLGMNVWFLNDWDGSFAFVDAMKQARPWQAAADWHDPVATDELGWPLADASTVIYAGPADKINGTHKLVFNGQADIELMWTWGRGSVSNIAYDPSSNTTTADISFDVVDAGTVGLILRNTRRTADSPLNSGFTNMRLYRPGYPADGSVVFTREIVEAIKKVKVLRLMDWTQTNNNMVVNWADRRTPLHMSKTAVPYTGPGGQTWSNFGLGVAIEHQIQMCNAANADCWINVPIVANDDYVRKLALALRYGTDGRNPYTSFTPNPVYPPLNANLRVYIEYANEIWNSAPGFQSFPAIMEIVQNLPPDHELFTPAIDNIWMNMWRYPAWRMITISTIFRDVYGDASMMNRVRPVLMTQQGNGQMSLEQPLTWMDAYLQRQAVARPITYYLYGAGGSGYYSHDVPVEQWGDADVYFARGLPQQNIRGMAFDALWAANFGLKRIAYEGGPSLDYYTLEQANAINLDPRMQSWMVDIHNAWSSVGGDLLVYYAARGPSSWEFTPDIANLDTPKWRALDTLNGQARVPVSLGQLLPGTILVGPPDDYMIRTGYDYRGTIGGLACIAGNDQGEWLAFPAYTRAAQTATLSVRGSSYEGATLRIWINGVAQGQITLPAGDGTTLDGSSARAVQLPLGQTIVRLQAVKGNFSLCAIDLR